MGSFRDMVMPPECELIEEMSGRVVMFVPLHECSLHAYAQKKSFHMTEADVEPIFKQVIDSTPDFVELPYCCWDYIVRVNGVY